MDQIFQIGVLCVVGAVLGLVLHHSCPEIGAALSLLIVVLVLLSLGESLQRLLNFLQALIRISGLPRDLFLPVCKTIGIAVLSRISQCLCRDMGNEGLAAVVELSGAITALLVSLPLLEAVLALLLELMP